MQDGILVDDRGRTSDPSIFAAGDCTRFTGPNGPVRLENWRHAQEHGAVVGRNAAGGDARLQRGAFVLVGAIRPLHPGRRLAGGGAERAGAAQDQRQGNAAFELDGAQIAYAMGTNAQRDIATVRRLIERRVAVDAGELADPTKPLNAMLRAEGVERTRHDDGDKERVGIVGAGRMGFAMLKHLVKKGFSVTACDLSAEAVEARGRRRRQDRRAPAALAKLCDFVILGVGYTDEVNAVVYGKDGLLENLAKGAIIAVSSTTSPFVVQEIDAAAKPKGIGVLDAPICRGRFAADEGTLLALIGGEPDVVERGRAVYSAFCSDYAHLGDVGHGQVGKTMNNLLLWVNAVG